MREPPACHFSFRDRVMQHGITARPTGQRYQADITVSVNFHRQGRPERGPTGHGHDMVDALSVWSGLFGTRTGVCGNARQLAALLAETRFIGKA